MDFDLYTPVAYVIFNRPDCVRQSFEGIRKAKPKQLFIIADGPRDDHPEDVELCRKCREIVGKVDWDCEVYHNYSDINLGCGKRPSSGFDWAFSQVDRAIILEDDCVPSLDFFYFCQRMLDKYEDDERIYSIAGLSYDILPSDHSDYYFSWFTNSTGWATWKRVWEQYDYTMKEYPSFRKRNELSDFFRIQSFADYWYHCFDLVYAGKLKSAWDYQFTFLSFLHKGLHIYPRSNLIKYIGFGESATHSKIEISPQDRFNCICREPDELVLPIKEPEIVKEDFNADFIRMTEVFRVSPDGSRFLHYIPYEIIRKIEDYGNHIILYGAGAMCREIISLFGKMSIDQFKVAVSETGKKQFIMGNEIHKITEFVNEANESLVILAVTEKYTEEMIKTLKELGFNNYLKLV